MIWAEGPSRCLPTVPDCFDSVRQKGLETFPKGPRHTGAARRREAHTEPNQAGRRRGPDRGPERPREAQKGPDMLSWVQKEKDGLAGFRVLQYTLGSELGDQAWRPFQECGWQAQQPSRACRGLADRSTAPAYPLEVRGVAGGFQGLGFRVLKGLGFGAEGSEELFFDPYLNYFDPCFNSHYPC